MFESPLQFNLLIWAAAVLFFVVTAVLFEFPALAALRPFRKLAPYLLSVLRIMSGLLLLQHGTGKYLNIPTGPMNNAAPTKLDGGALVINWSGAAGIFELIGGVLLILGLFTRPVAFVLSGFCAVAYFYAHAGRGFFPILNGGELAVLYSFVFLYLAAAGGGAWGLDRLRGQDKA